MNKIKLFCLIAMSTFAFSSCATFADEDILTLENIDQELQANNWKVNFYLNNNIDETSDFADFELTFKAGGELIAKKPFTEIAGRWIEDKVTKEIIFSFDANTAPFSKISEVWRIQKREDKTFQFVNFNDTELVKITHP